MAIYARVIQLNPGLFVYFVGLKDNSILSSLCVGSRSEHERIDGACSLLCTLSCNSRVRLNNLLREDDANGTNNP